MVSHEHSGEFNPTILRQNGFRIEQAANRAGTISWLQGTSTVRFDYDEVLKTGKLQAWTLEGDLAQGLEAGIALYLELIRHGGVCTFSRLEQLTGLTSRQLSNIATRANAHFEPIGGLTSFMQSERLLRMNILPDELALKTWFDYVGTSIEKLREAGSRGVKTLPVPYGELVFAESQALRSEGIDRAHLYQRHDTHPNSPKNRLVSVSEQIEPLVAHMIQNRGVVPRRELDDFASWNTPLQANLRPIYEEDPLFRTFSYGNRDPSYSVLWGVDEQFEVMDRAIGAFSQAEPNEVHSFRLPHCTILSLDTSSRKQRGMIGNFVLVTDHQDKLLQAIPLRLTQVQERVMRWLRSYHFAPLYDIDPANHAIVGELNQRFRETTGDDLVTYSDRLGYHLPGDFAAPYRFIRRRLNEEQLMDPDLEGHSTCQYGSSRVVYTGQEEAANRYKIRSSFVAVQQPGRKDDIVVFPFRHADELLRELVRNGGELTREQLEAIRIDHKRYQTLLQRVNERSIAMNGVPLLEPTDSRGYRLHSDLLQSHSQQPQSEPVHPAVVGSSTDRSPEKVTVIPLAQAPDGSRILVEPTENHIILQLPGQTPIPVLLCPQEHEVITQPGRHRKFLFELHKFDLMRQRAARHYGVSIQPIQIPETTRDRYASIVNGAEVGHIMVASHTEILAFEQMIESSKEFLSSLNQETVKELTGFKIRDTDQLRWLQYPHMDGFTEAQVLREWHYNPKRWSDAAKAVFAALGLRISLLHAHQRNVQSRIVEAYISHGMNQSAMVLEHGLPRYGYTFSSMLWGKLEETLPTFSNQ